MQERTVIELKISILGINIFLNEGTLIKECQDALKRKKRGHFSSPS